MSKFKYVYQLWPAQLFITIRAWASNGSLCLLYDWFIYPSRTAKLGPWILCQRQRQNLK